MAIEEWLRPQGRFAHLLGEEHRDKVAEIQARVDADWDALVARCEADAASAEPAAAPAG